ncbi:hypothetical protein [Natronospora cellulosivora (SeqCode)]
MGKQEFIKSVLNLKENKPAAYEIILKYFYLKLHSEDKVSESEFVSSIETLNIDGLKDFLSEFWDMFHKQDDIPEG